MNRILSAVFAFLLATAASAQEEKIKAVVERYDASFTMASQSVGTYKVNKRVRVLDKDAADQAAADAVIAKINAIGTVTLDSKAAIEAARAA